MLAGQQASRLAGGKASRVSGAKFSVSISLFLSFVNSAIRVAVGGDLSLFDTIRPPITDMPDALFTAPLPLSARSCPPPCLLAAWTTLRWWQAVLTAVRTSTTCMEDPHPLSSGERLLTACLPACLALWLNHR